MKKLYRSGYSLIETALVIVLVGLVFTALFESLGNMQKYNSTSQVDDDLSIEGQKVLGMITDDLQSSGWYIPDPTADHSSSLLNDRSDYYYPYLQEQFNQSSVNLLGSRFPHHTRTASMAQVTLVKSTNLPGSPADWNNSNLDDPTYLRSHYARSQEIIFLKIHGGSWDANPGLQKLNTVNFAGDYTVPNNRDALGIRRMGDLGRGTTFDTDPISGLRRYYLTYGSYKVYDIMPTAVWLRVPVTTPTNYELGMPLRWETCTQFPTMSPATTTLPATIDPRELREYTFAVVPNPAGGHGQLVRASKRLSTTAGDRIISTGSFTPPAGGAAVTCWMVVDKVLSDKVDRVTFDTFRTDRGGKLELNQIRARVYLSLESAIATGAPVSRMVETTVGLRSTTDAETVNELTGIIGNAGSYVLNQ